jgi:GNAT superfamily N-acetyltransferase
MYTDPDFVRRGIGRLVLSLCEDAARAAGFRRAEMMATMAGVPLYAACGYAPIEHVARLSSEGEAVPGVRMGKAL